MIKTLKFLVLFLIVVELGYSQQALNKIILDYSNTRTSNILSNPNLVGSNYINEQFSEANLTGYDQNFMVRFDAYSNEMEANVDGKSNYLKKNLGMKVSFLEPEKVYQVFNFKEGDESKQVFFVVINEGAKLSLLLKEIIEFQEEVQPKTNFDKYKPPTFKQEKSKYFFGDKNNVAIEVSRKNKDFYNLFGANSKQMETYIKANKLGIKKDEDLINIINYYNSLK